jgi:hypothetical protein
MVYIWNNRMNLKATRIYGRQKTVAFKFEGQLRSAETAGSVDLPVVSTGGSVLLTSKILDLYAQGLIQEKFTNF